MPCIYRFIKQHCHRPYIVKNYDKLFRKSHYKLVLALVEGPSDLRFWRQLFKKIIPKNIIVDVEYIGKPDGKDYLLNLIIKTDKNFVICVDSDFDYILDENRDQAKLMKSIAGCFQTYSYSIENIFCITNGINEISPEKSITTSYDLASLYNNELDIKKFIHDLSRILFKPFVYSIYEANRNNGPPNLSEINNILMKLNATLRKKTSITNDDAKRILDDIKKNVEILNSTTYDTVEYNYITQTKKDLKKKGVKKKETYLYIKGKIIMEVVVQLLKKTISSKVSSRRKLIMNIPSRSEQIKKIQEYNNLLREEGSLKVYLAKRIDKFEENHLFSKIEKDMKRFVDIYYK